MKTRSLLFLALIFSAPLMSAEHSEYTVPMHLLSSAKESAVGSIRLQDSDYGLLIYPNLQQLPPGIHALHVHENPSCANNGEAAGAHFDPKQTQQHLGPYNNQGHLGDMPVLYVDANGQATIPMLAPRLTIKAVMQRTLVIKSGADNYADQPQVNGGGGARLACGIIGKAEVPEVTESQPDA
jgi:Cu-Zn family superoxide dismutase